MAHQLLTYFKCPQPRSTPYKEKSRKLFFSPLRRFNDGFEKSGGQQEGGCIKIKKARKDVHRSKRQTKNFCCSPLVGFWPLVSPVSCHLKNYTKCSVYMKDPRLQTEASLVNVYFSVPVVPPPSTSID